MGFAHHLARHSFHVVAHFKLLIFLSLIALLIFFAYSFLLNFNEPAPKFIMSDDKLLFGYSTGSVHNKIGIVSVLNRPELAGEEFQFALSTVRCYALRHPGVSHFILISAEANSDCAQSDFMFRRHCHVANWMAVHPEFSWLLFLDADMAVVNPRHRIEEFIDKDNELVFIDRLFNNEIMAGSYLARNGQFARQFLHSWANFFYRLPNSFHGTDNGAIHALFMEKYSDLRHRNACQHYWESSKNFSDLSVFEVCVQHFLHGQMLNRTLDGGRVKILPRGRGWVRDGGHTGSRFSRRDFMLHGWKNSTFNKRAFNPWRNPFTPEQRFDDASLCADNTTDWAHKRWMVVDEATIDSELAAVVDRTKREYQSILERIGLTD